MRLRRFLLPFRRNPGFLLALAQQEGEIVHTRLGSRHIFFLNHPDAVREVLTTHHECFSKGGGYKRAQFWLGDGVVLREGAEHRARRQLMRPAFLPDRIAASAAVIVRQGARFAEQRHAGEVLDLVPAMMRLSLAVLADCLCGLTSDEEIDILDRAISTLSGTFDRVAPWSQLFGGRADAATSLERLDEVIYGVIRRRRQGHTGSDLLGLLLAEPELTDQAIRDELVTLFMAGRASVAGHLTWAWYLLSQHPDIEAQFHAEIEEVLKGRPATSEDIPQLRLTRRILAETLRCYPPAWATGRRAIKACQIGATSIPAGSVVLMSQYVMHHDSRYYSDPFRFDPARWEHTEQRNRPRYAFFPFSGGPRRCLGEPLAWSEAILLMVTIAQCWRLRLLPKQPVELSAGSSLQPKGGLLMFLEAR